MSIVHVAFYPSDWLAGTRGMSAEETGVYITLIARIYEMAGPIERDDERLARLCGCKTKNRFQKVLAYLLDEGKIIERDGFLTNERAEKEIENVTGKSAKARQAAEARWRKKGNRNSACTDALASPEHMRTQCKETCQPEPEPDIGGGGGGSARAREGPSDRSSELPSHPTHRERLLAAMGHDPTGITATGRMVGTEIDMAEVRRWADLGISEDQQIAVVKEVMARKRDGPPNSFRFFRQPMQRVAAALSEGPLTPLPQDQRAQSPSGRPSIDVAAIIANLPSKD